MQKHPPCKAYQKGQSVCADGFVQKPYCTGKYGCPVCGRSDARVLPHCLTEEVPSHLARSDGSPIMYNKRPAP